MKKFFSDFKKFITRGNILDMAVGVVVGSAFTAIVNALTNKILMPLINLILSLGGSGLDSAYTMLKPAYDATGALDLANSIYIDWGAFITAIINFFIIALTVFIILRIAMNAKGYLNKTKLSYELKEELKEKGIDVKDKEAVKAEILRMEEEKKAKQAKEEEEKKQNSTEYLLKEIRDLLKENAQLKQSVQQEEKKQNKKKTKKETADSYDSTN